MENETSVILQSSGFVRAWPAGWLYGAEVSLSLKRKVLTGLLVVSVVAIAFVYAQVKSAAVATAMRDFRDQLMAAERAPGDKQAWDELNIRLINLLGALRDSTPDYPRAAAVKGATQQRREP